MLILRYLFFLTLVLGLISGVHAQEATPEQTVEPDNTNILIPVNTAENSGINVAYYFDRIKQGRIGLLQITGDVVELEVTAFNRQQPVLKMTGYEGFFVLLAVDMDQTVRTYDVNYRIQRADGTREVLTDRIRVDNGGFIQQTVTLPEDRLALIDPEVEQAELQMLFELAVPRTADILWDETGFLPPMATELTSPFGAVRVFNETFNTRHTGWDFQATIGQPIATSASGEVVFAGQLPIRGNYVMLHHGQGIYSGYAHLSVTHVTQGQNVKAGQFIGQVGSTGRSSSAHAHVEFIVNGVWSDAADIIRMAFPLPDEFTENS
jgi:murein DD-endopeptidase MepM/ murein hydrolase activator NlpD